MAALSQAITAAYAEVIKDKGNKPFDQWSNSSVLNALENKGFVDKSMGGSTIEFSLDIAINAGADILTLDTTAVSTTVTDVLGGASYSWRPIVSPINYTLHDEAKLENAGSNVKVPFLRSLAENAIASHDQVIETALFASSATDSFESFKTLFPDAGQPNVGSIDGASATYWRSQFETAQSDGSDLLLAMGLVHDAASRGTGGSQPTLVVSGVDSKSLFEAQLTPLQRYESMKVGVGGFEALKFRNADYVYSNAGGTRIYMLGPKGFKLVVNKAAWRKLDPAVRLTAAAQRQQLIFTSAQACTQAPSRCGVVVVS